MDSKDKQELFGWEGWEVYWARVKARRLRVFFGWGRWVGGWGGDLAESYKHLITEYFTLRERT